MYEAGRVKINSYNSSESPSDESKLSEILVFWIIASKLVKKASNNNEIQIIEFQIIDFLRPYKIHLNSHTFWFFLII